MSTILTSFMHGNVRPGIGSATRPVTNEKREWSLELERALVVRAQRGDEAALGRLLDHFAGPLFGAVILPRVGSRSEAEELLAETLERAAMKLEDFRFSDAHGLWPWLRRIATSRIIDRARRRHAARGMAERYEAELHTLGPHLTPGAEEAIIEAEEKRDREARLGASLSSISERYRRAIELRVYEERDREACARELGVTLGTFDVLLHRALGALRKAFGDIV